MFYLRFAMIRPYQQSDADRLITIWLESSAIAHSFIDYGYWERNAAAMRSVYLPTAKTFVWINETDHQIAGFISMAGSTVAALFVAPGYQQSGIGNALIRFAKQQHDTLNLYVYCLNRKAFSFYRKHGFEVIETNTDPGTGEDQYHMVFRRTDSSEF